MAKNRRWTAVEDEQIRQAACYNRNFGRPPTGHGRYQELALRLGRTEAAVKMRAKRIGAISYGKKAQHNLFDQAAT